MLYHLFATQHMPQSSNTRLLQKSSLAALVLCLAFAVVGSVAFANGQKIYTSKGCPACHGPKGGTTLVPNYPKIKGQNAAYTIAQLKAFKAKQRKSAQSALMWGQSAQLSTSDMKQIANWLAKQK